MSSGTAEQYDENEFFTPRGTRETTYKVGDKEYPITIHIPDNFEHDKLMEEFTTIDEEREIMTVQQAEVIETRMLRYIKNAPFKCGKVAWNKANEQQKTKALRSLNADHKTAINRLIIGKSVLTKEEENFLSKE